MGAVAKLAQALDELASDHRCQGWIDRTAARDLTRRAPLANDFRRLVRSDYDALALTGRARSDIELYEREANASGDLFFLRQAALEPTRGWERGVSTGLTASGAQSAYLALYKDPSAAGRILAFGYDPAGSRNLFVFSVALTDELSFKNQWTIDVGAWKQSRQTLPGEDGITDGIGGTTPPPRPQLDDMMWAHAFYHSSIQTQIESGQGATGG